MTTTAAALQWAIVVCGSGALAALAVSPPGCHQTYLGSRQRFQHNEHSRWVHRALQCAACHGSSGSGNGSDGVGQFCFAHHNASTAGVCSISGNATQSLHALLGEAVQPSHVECMHTSYSDPWYTDWLALVDLVVSLVLLVLPGVAWLLRLANRHNRLSDAFDVGHNLRRLVRLPANNPITAVYGIRVLCMVWVLFGHSMSNAQFFMPDADRQRWYGQLQQQPLALLITNFTLSVDVFFLLSATLTAYSFFQKAAKEGSTARRDWRFWLRFYRHRWLRLWPSYAYFMCTMMARYSISGAHAPWPYADPRRQCSGVWWQNLLFVSVWFDNACLNWLWYVSCDWAFYLASPLFLSALSASSDGRLGRLLIWLCIAGSCLWRAGLIIAHNHPATSMVFVQPDNYNQYVLQHYFQIYIRPYTRIGPYLLGLLLGRYLTTAQQGTQSGLQLASGALLCALALGGLYPIVNNYAWPLYNAVYGSVHRLLFALGTAALIAHCHGRAEGRLNRALSARAWIPLANVSYGCYLFNMLPSIAAYSWYGMPYHWQGYLYHVLVYFVFQVASSYVFGLFMCLTVEMPCLNLERLLLGAAANKPDKNQPVAV